MYSTDSKSRMVDVGVQTEPISMDLPTYHEATKHKPEDVTRLKRFMCASLNREYGIHIYKQGLGFKEHMKWAEVGRYRKECETLATTTIYTAGEKTDRLRKLEVLNRDYIEKPCQVLGMDQEIVMEYAVAHECILESNFRKKLRVKYMTTPGNWAKKLLRDLHAVIDQVYDSEEHKDKLRVKLQAEIDLWFTNLEDETTWELSDHGRIFWHWQKVKSN